MYISQIKRDFKTLMKLQKYKEALNFKIDFLKIKNIIIRVT